MKSFSHLCSNRTFMELKYQEITDFALCVRSSNRTFMELKLLAPLALDADLIQF